MRSPSRCTVLLLAVLALGGCAATGPFTIQTPGIGMLEAEAPHLYGAPPSAMSALGAGTLQERVLNLITTYEEELVRAERAQGGVLNTMLAILGLALPLSGTAAAIGLSDPDDAQTVAIVAGTATTVVMLTDLIFKPGNRQAAAVQCAGFLESALEAIRLQWDESSIASLSGTEEDWDQYLTVRGTLEPARATACPT